MRRCVCALAGSASVAIQYDTCQQACVRTIVACSCVHSLRYRPQAMMRHHVYSTIDINMPILTGMPQPRIDFTRHTVILSPLLILYHNSLGVLKHAGVNNNDVLGDRSQATITTPTCGTMKCIGPITPAWTLNTCRTCATPAQIVRRSG